MLSIPRQTQRTRREKSSDQTNEMKKKKNVVTPFTGKKNTVRNPTSRPEVCFLSPGVHLERRRVGHQGRGVLICHRLSERGFLWTHTNTHTHTYTHPSLNWPRTLLVLPSPPLPYLPSQASCSPLALIRCYLQPSKHLRGTLGDHWSHYHEK